MTKRLKQQTVKGVFWSFLEKIGSKLILLLTQVILARLLMPSDFGLIGMLTIFVIISQVFVDSGLGNALIQKQNTKQIDYSSVFFCNIIISFILYSLLFISSPAIAKFFNQSELVLLLRLVGLVLIFDSFGAVQFVKFRKELKFKIIAKATVLSNILSAIIGITLAYLNFGVLALAIQMILIYFFRTIFFWLYSDWMPSFVFSWESFKSLFNFGYKLLLSSLLDQVFRNIYLLIIGKLYTASDLGYYTQAKNLQQVPVSTLSSVVISVTFPTFSKLQNDDERLLAGLRKTLKLLVFINFPLMLGLSVIAEPLFFYVLGEKWLPAVPYFQLLCISGMLYTLQTLNLNLLQVKGRTDLYLKLEIIKKIIVVLAILIGVNWGVIGLVWSSVITSFIAYFINSYYSGKLANYSIFDQIKDIYKYIVVTLIMALGMYLFTTIFKMSFMVFIGQIILGIIMYFVISYITKLEACMESLSILKDNLMLPKWMRKEY